jgi:predicted nucleotide-binding protein
MGDQDIKVKRVDAKNVSFRGDAGDHTHWPNAAHHAPERSRGESDGSRRVFVIHGRDEEARIALFDLLRALGLQPLEWEQLVRDTGAGAPSLAEIVSDAARGAQAVVALLTPDDVVALHPSLRTVEDAEDEQAVGCQARPNVYLELGMALAACPDRTIIVEAGATRRPADLAGLNYIRIDKTAGWCNKLAERLRSAGCPVDRAGTDWQRTSRFTWLAAHDRRPPRAYDRRW